MRLAADEDLDNHIVEACARRLGQPLHLDPNQPLSAEFIGYLEFPVGGKSRRVEFLEHGVRYAFPAEPGPVTRGVPTSVSAPPLDSLMQRDSAGDLVWPHIEGKVTGQSVVPLHANVPAIAIRNRALHELLALVDDDLEAKLRRAARSGSSEWIESWGCSDGSRNTEARPDIGPLTVPTKRGRRPKAPEFREVMLASPRGHPQY